MTSLIPKTTSSFHHKWQRVSHWEAVISLSPEELSPSFSSASSLPEPSSLSSSKAYGDGDRDAAKPPMTACHRAIRSTRVFTWHNSSLKVSSEHPCAQAVQWWPRESLHLWKEEPRWMEQKKPEESPSRFVVTSVEAGPRSVEWSLCLWNTW